MRPEGIVQNLINAEAVCKYASASMNGLRRLNEEEKWGKKFDYSGFVLLQ